MVAVQTSPNHRGAVGRATETTLVAVLTVVVLATVVVVLAAGVTSSPVSSPAGSPVGSPAGSPVGSPAGSPVASPAGEPGAAVDGIATLAAPSAQAVVATAVSATAATAVDHDDPVGFTLGDLAAGQVSPETFDAFWEAEAERIRNGPCPAPAAPGTTVVVLSVGATPPAHLAGDYTDHAPLIADARAEAAAACS